MARIVGLTVLPCVLMCGVIMLLAWRPWRRGIRPVRGEWGAPMGLGAGFVASYIACSIVLNSAIPDWLPQERWQWMLIMAVAATCFGLICAGWRPQGWETVFLYAVTAFCIAWLLQPTDAVAHPIAQKVVVGLSGLVISLNLEFLARRRPGASLPLAMGGVFAGAAAIFLQSGFARLSLLAGAVSSALIVIAALARWNGSVNLRDGGMLWLGAMLSVLLGIGSDTGYNTGELNMASFALIAAAPLALWLGEMEFVKKMRPWKGALARVALVSVPVIIALALAWPFTMPPM